MIEPGPGRSISRRTSIFGAAAAASLSPITRAMAAVRPNRSTLESVNIAVVGSGGRGADNINDLKDCGVNFVALCDCDERRAEESFRRFPGAKRYSDWRKMFEQEKGFDAVLVATPDHNHAIVSIAAMKTGKHVYSEKPLAHSVWEARQMAKAAAENGVATQMGTQGHAYEGTRRAVEVIRAGAIGEVRVLHVWTDRPAGWWAQGGTRPAHTTPVAATLDLDRLVRP